MPKKQEVNENVLIQDVPAWVLMMKVESDWSGWKHGLVGNFPINEDTFGSVIDLEEEEEDDEQAPFPEYDSTIKSLELLKEAGIVFDKKKGTWKSK